MKNNILIALAICATMQLAHAQYPDFTYESPKIKAQARNLTKVYDAELALDGEQIVIVQDKIEDYLVLSNSVKKNLEGQEELDALTELMIKETLDMQDVLTRPQYERYKQIRQRVQPIKVYSKK